MSQEFHFLDLLDLAPTVREFLGPDTSARLIGHACQASRQWRDFGAGEGRIALHSIKPRSLQALQEAVVGVRIDWLHSINFRLFKHLDWIATLAPDAEPSGCHALAEALPPCTLESLTLDLGRNSIDEEGCEKLATALGRCHVKVLVLDMPQNFVGPEGAASLAEALVRVKGIHDIFFPKISR